MYCYWSDKLSGEFGGEKEIFVTQDAYALLDKLRVPTHTSRYDKALAARHKLVGAPLSLDVVTEVIDIVDAGAFAEALTT